MLNWQQLRRPSIKQIKLKLWNKAHYKRLWNIFEAALESNSGTEWRGVDCFEKLQPEVDLEFWLMSLVGYHHVNQKSHEHKITMRMEEAEAPYFNGNFLVYDVVVTKSWVIA